MSDENLTKKTPVAKRNRLGKGLYKRGNIWWICFADQWGKTHQVSSRSRNKVDAERLLAKCRQEVYDGTFFPQKNKYNPNFAQLEIDYFEHDKTRRKSDLAKDRQRFKRIIEFFKPKTMVRSIDSQDVKNFRQWLSEQPVTKSGKLMSPATVTRHMALLHCALKRCVGFHPNWNPFLNVEYRVDSKSPRKAFTEQEYRLLLDKADDQLKTIMVISWKLGLRLSAVWNLTWDMVDDSNPERPRLILPEGYLKNKEPLDLPLSRLMYRMMKALPKQEDNRIFEPLHTSTISSRFSNLARSNGINKTFHDFRTTAATNLRKAGISTSTVMAILGWKSPQMFQRYDKIDINDKFEAIDKLPD